MRDMSARLLSSVAVALTFALTAAPAYAASPPRFVTTQWLVRVATGAPAGFLARAVDRDGDAVTLTWAFDDGATATGERVAHVWSTAGSHTGTVTATDATGRHTSVSFTIEVVDGALDPQPGGVVLPRPGPAPAATARVALAGGPLRMAPDGSVALRLTCAHGADCAGQVSLARGGRRIAAAPFAVPAGRRTTVRLRLPAAVLARVRHGGSRAVVVTLAPDAQAPVREARTLRVA
jgi:PKD domain-containing protein